MIIDTDYYRGICTTNTTSWTITQPTTVTTGYTPTYGYNPTVAQYRDLWNDIRTNELIDLEPIGQIEIEPVPVSEKEYESEELDVLYGDLLRDE